MYKDLCSLKDFYNERIGKQNNKPDHLISIHDIVMQLDYGTKLEQVRYLHTYTR